MSGGAFDYAQNRFDWEIAEPIQKEIAQNKKKPSWILDESWDGQRYSDRTIQEFRNGLEILRQAYVYVQRIDWLLSGDDSEETFHERLKEDLNSFKFQEYTLEDYDEKDED